MDGEYIEFTPIAKQMSEKLKNFKPYEKFPTLKNEYINIFMSQILSFILKVPRVYSTSI